MFSPPSLLSWYFHYTYDAVFDGRPPPPFLGESFHLWGEGKEGAVLGLYGSELASLVVV